MNCFTRRPNENPATCVTGFSRGQGFLLTRRSPCLPTQGSLLLRSLGQKKYEAVHIFSVPFESLLKK
ncbi:hypothetical protein GYA13_05195 [Candidatus Kuenenbacteria bacterium]|nr:hypothetical protein [Candidatus Kuenenbacteria bacterium]